MIDIDEVKEALEEISGLDSDTLDGFSVLIQNAVASADAQFEEDSDLAVMYAAAKANYDISLALNSQDKITSFAAGDVKITEDNQRLESAKALYESIIGDCTGTVSDNGFVFKTV